MCMFFYIKKTDENGKSVIILFEERESSLFLFDKYSMCSLIKWV